MNTKIIDVMPITEVHRKSESRGPLSGQIFLNELTQKGAFRRDKPQFKKQYIITKVKSF